MDNTAIVVAGGVVSSSNEAASSSIDEKEKKSRIGARVRAFSEVISAIDEHVAVIGAEEGGEVNNAIIDSLLQLKERVENMRVGLAGDAAGRYYVGITTAGEVVSFRSATVPRKTSHGSKFSHVNGPFPKSVSEFIAKNGMTPSDNVLF
jgi:hypothetical protein